MRALHQLLSSMLSKEELSELSASFDIVGTIAILDIPQSLKSKERLIGRKFLESFKQLKTIVARSGTHTGEFRTRKVRVIAGKRTKTTTQKEAGVLLRVNVETCYFSPRFGSERLRMASLVRPGERVLVMFSGVGPFPLVISRNASPKLVVGVEKNSACHKFALENKVLNRKAGERIQFFGGDVRDILLTLKKFDRIIMPLPSDAFEFVPLALKHLVRGGWIHVYSFARPEEFGDAEKKLKTLCKECKRKCSRVSIVKCGEKSPGVFRVCVEGKVS